MHQMPGLNHLSGNGRTPGSTALGLHYDVVDLNPSLVPWSMLLFLKFFFLPLSSTVQSFCSHCKDELSTCHS